MEALEIVTVFTLNVAGFVIPITETVIVSWAVMLILIVGSLLLTRRLKTIPTGPQVILEAAIEFLNNFSKNQFGKFSNFLGPYIGTVFLFILIACFIAVLSPVSFSVFGREFIPLFSIKPPTKDINVTAALALMSITLLLVCGFAARGIIGWFKHLLHPFPVMLPFNIMEYAIRLFSLAFRLFGSITGGYVMMHLIIGVIPVALPVVFSLYFDFFDGAIQAVIFVFLTSLYISEAVKVHEE